MDNETFIFLVSIGGFLLFSILFFRWTEKITAIDKEGKPNSVLGYNIAFDFMAWMVTAIIIVISFVLYFKEDFKDLVILVLGISIGSVLTRTPSFKERDKN